MKRFHQNFDHSLRDATLHIRGKLLPGTQKFFFFVTVGTFPPQEGAPKNCIDRRPYVFRDTLGETHSAQTGTRARRLGRNNARAVAPLHNHRPPPETETLTKEPNMAHTLPARKRGVSDSFRAEGIP